MSRPEFLFLKINQRGVLISSRGRKNFEKLINVPPPAFISYLRVFINDALKSMLTPLANPHAKRCFGLNSLFRPLYVHVNPT